MLMQNFGVTNKDHYGMLWYFWSGLLGVSRGNEKLIMRVHKPKVEYKLALQEKPQGSILTYYYKNKKLNKDQLKHATHNC